MAFAGGLLPRKWWSAATLGPGLDVALLLVAYPSARRATLEVDGPVALQGVAVLGVLVFAVRMAAAAAVGYPSPSGTGNVAGRRRVRR